MGVLGISCWPILSLDVHTIYTCTQCVLYIIVCIIYYTVFLSIPPEHTSTAWPLLPQFLLSGLLFLSHLHSHLLQVFPAPTLLQPIQYTPYHCLLLWSNTLLSVFQDAYTIGIFHHVQSSNQLIGIRAKCSSTPGISASRSHGRTCSISFQANCLATLGL